MAVARVGENDLYYEVHGEGAGLPAVLIMGLATDLHGWERQVPALSPARRLLLLDNRGAGRSAKPPGPYSTAALADDTVAVMDAAGVGRAHIVGMSLGGAIAQELTLRHPARVASLALVATFADGTRMRPTAGKGLAAAGKPPAFDLEAMLTAAGSGQFPIDPRMVYEFLTPMVFSAAFRERERDFLKTMFKRAMTYGFSPAALAGQVSAALGHNSIARLGEIAAPTLVVHGTGDALVPGKASRPLSEGIRGARRVEIEGATHGFNFEMADELNALLTGWLAEHDA